MTYTFFLVERFSKHILITINRPKSKNAINLALMDELDSLLSEIESKAYSLVVFKTHVDGFFCSGGDLKEFHSLITEEDGLMMASKMSGLLKRLEQLPSITISFISGYAFGGGTEFALATDLIYVTPKAHIGFTQAKFGLIPGWNGMGRLIQKTSYSTALHLLLNQSILNGKQALELKFADALFESESHFEEQLTVLLKSAEIVLKGLKQSARLYRPILDDSIQKQELHLFSTLWGAKEHHDAVDAFFKAKKLASNKD